MKKKIFSLLTMCLLLCSLLVTPVSAVQAAETTSNEASKGISRYSTNYFSGITGTMNTMAGTQSKIFNVSSGSVSTNAKVTTVELNVTVSRGSIPFYIVVKCPSGKYVEKYVSASGKITLTDFKDVSPKGTWQIYIYNMGSAFTDVSTATARMTVNYQY